MMRAAYAAATALVCLAAMPAQTSLSPQMMVHHPRSWGNSTVYVVELLGRRLWMRCIDTVNDTDAACMCTAMMAVAESCGTQKLLLFSQELGRGWTP